MTIIFGMKATHPGTSYSSFVVILSPRSAIFLAWLTHRGWRASPKPSKAKSSARGNRTRGLGPGHPDRHRGIGLHGSHVINTVSTLVEKGPAAQALAARCAGNCYVDEGRQGTLAALTKDPRIRLRASTASAKFSGVPLGDVTTIATLNLTPCVRDRCAAEGCPGNAGSTPGKPTDQVAGIQASPDHRCFGC